MSANEIRRFVKIVEGELIPQRANTIRIDADDYKLYRALLHMPSPENFTRSSQFGKIGMMTFWDTPSYLETKAKLDKLGVPYEEEPEGMTTDWDEELTSETEHNMSPYPSNTGIYDHDTGDSTSRPSRNLRTRKKSVPVKPIPQHVPSQKNPTMKLKDVRKQSAPDRW